MTTTTDPRRVKDLFLAAADLHPAARPPYLAAQCGPDDSLLAAVNRLLAAHDRPDQLVNAAAGTAAGEVLGGKYKLMELLGTGGMGEVWVAKQSEPVRRLVALKLIRAGMATPQVLSRFDAERQAIALMDHPNIAKVLDAGRTPDGRPYFAMELIKGVPVTQFCDENHLTPRQRLELFVPVCEAIQHAHQKGVIHRDIKPSNVLVALYDDRPVPKVIDFGVAKAAGRELTAQTLYTVFGAVVGTPEYMSPEQAGLNQLDVDTRSDVYSLGVLLYELLAGSTPFPKAELQAAGLLEMLRVIREKDPPKPSTRLSTADGLPALAARRGTEPKRLTGQVRGELDWIVMKTLEKDRTRRYDTAAGLAADVRRHLAGEAVLAVPPGAVYRMRKFARRHRGAVLAAGGLALALFTGMVGLTAGLIRTEALRRDAVAERDAKEQARQEQARLREAADAERAAAEAVTQFVREDLLGQAAATAQADRRFDPDATLTVRAALDRAAAGVGARFTGRPLAEAAVRRTIGEAYLEVGEAEKGVSHLKRAADLLADLRGPRHDDTLAVRGALAAAYNDVGEHAAARRLREDLLAARVAAGGDESAAAVAAANDLAFAHRDHGRRDEAARLHAFVYAVRAKQNGPGHPETRRAAYELAVTRGDRAAVAAVIPDLEREYAAAAAAKVAGHPDVIDAARRLAGACHAAGRDEEAIRLLTAAAAASARAWGDASPHALGALDLLAAVYHEAGDLAAAIRTEERTRDVRAKTLGGRPPADAGHDEQLGRRLPRRRPAARRLPDARRGLGRDPGQVRAGPPVRGGRPRQLGEDS